MKILFFHAGLGYGGASKMMASIANNLSSMHEVILMTYRNDNVKQNLNKSVKFEYNPLYKNPFKPLEISGQIIELHKYLIANNIDLVIAFLHPSNYIATIASKGTKTKVLLSERGDPYSRLSNGGLFVKLVERINYCADAYVFQSDGAAKAYPQKCRDKGVIIPNALPDKQYPIHISTPEKIIINVARLEVLQKRQDVLIDAFAIFVKDHPEYSLYFVGDGPDLDVLEERVASQNLQDKVLFLGARTDVLELLSKAAVFALSSDYEGLPNALLEAMAVGIPCVSTDCSPGGARMIIDDGVDGYIVERGNSQMLATRMNQIVSNPGIGEQFSGNAKVKVRSVFNQSKIDKMWDDFISLHGDRI